MNPRCSTSQELVELHPPKASSCCAPAENGVKTQLTPFCAFRLVSNHCTALIQPRCIIIRAPIDCGQFSLLTTSWPNVWGFSRLLPCNIPYTDFAEFTFHALG